jgi:phosphoribosyl 1,2-cyclic phosphodiesterase
VTTARFTVLASGSSGNASLLEADGFGLLIDCGLHPRFLTARLQSIGTSWERVSAVLLTHTHTDHLRSRRIPLYGHPDHFTQLECAAPAFASLRTAGLARAYLEATPFELSKQLTCRPLRVSHDSLPTFGFRIDGRDGGPDPAWAIGYAADLGCGSPEIIDAFAGVDILALEFNHDEMMERRSKRPRFLKDRVMGDRGHLSNSQAAEIATAIASCSGEGFPRHLIQLHLSRECNTPELASTAGREALAVLSPTTEIITARQDAAAKTILLARRPNSATRAVARAARPAPKRRIVQPSLPGFDSSEW